MSKSIVLLSTNDHGGAGELSFRITRALRELGNEALLLVKHKLKNDRFVIQLPEAVQPSYSLTRRVLRKVDNKARVSIAWFIKQGRYSEITILRTNPNFYFFNKDENISLIDTDSIIKAIPFKPDLIIVGWVSEFINTRNMQQLMSATKAPLYWLTTDMAPLTGGCHYAWNCLGYTSDCANCPAILTEELKQTAKRNLALKISHIQASNIQVLAGSEWCRRQAAASTLFRSQPAIQVLNGPIDQNIFNNRCRDIAKKVFSVDATKKLIFTGSTFSHEKRKGIEYLVIALQQLYKRMTIVERSNVQILVAGNHVLENELIKRIPFEIVPFDFIKDTLLLSLAYQAADLFVCSSIEDSGPMMVTEALACGTPVVGFDLGFTSDIVEHGVNGFRVPVENTELLTEYMHKVLCLSKDESGQFSRNAIQAINDKASLQQLKKVINSLLN